MELITEHIIKKENSYRVDKRLMGSAFSLMVIHEDEKIAQQLLVAGINEIERIETLLSEFIPHSDTGRINNARDLEKTIVSEETFNLIRRSNNISTMTNGAFDISVAPLKKIYRFKNENFTMPDPSIIGETLVHTGYQHIEMNVEECSIRFKKPKMKISFSAIGKGYASDMVMKLWKKEGLKNGYVNASGDLNAFGTGPDGMPWNIGIADPENETKILLKIPVYNSSVATSGDSQQHFMYKGKRFSHNINPKTGLPLSGMQSVTVLSPAAELSDALATAVYVMGVKEGLEFVKNLPETHAIIIDEKKRIHFSQNINYEAIR